MTGVVGGFVDLAEIVIGDVQPESRLMVFSFLKKPLGFSRDASYGFPLYGYYPGRESSPEPLLRERYAV
jgi:hypothetical protein